MEILIMPYVERLLSCGFPVTCAEQMCRAAAVNGAGEVERLVRSNELFYNDFKQYPSGR
jgi:hypothetical protein